MRAGGGELVKMAKKGGDGRSVCVDFTMRVERRRGFWLDAEGEVGWEKGSFEKGMFETCWDSRP